MIRAPQAALGVVLLFASLGCEPTPRPGPKTTAKFGVFFGGQIEERRDIPFEVDTSRQTQGFRVEFGEPLRQPTDVEWRIDRPTVARKKPGRKAPAVPEAPRGPITGKEPVRAGEQRFERVLRLEPGDPLGLWNVRVVTEGQVVLDRPFEVYDPVARERATPDDGGS